MSRRPCLVFQLLWVVAIAFTQAWAQPAPSSMYEATVALSANTERGRAQAFAEAMRQVLVQVTGRAGAPEEPGLAALVNDAGRYVQIYRPVPGGMLLVGFDGRRIDALVGAADPGQIRSVAVAVSGIADVDSYARVTAALEALMPVRRLEVVELHGDTVTYRASVRGDAGQLAQAVGGIAHLRPDDAGLADTGGLRYRYLQ
jgi:hypothetical protein